MTSAKITELLKNKGDGDSDPKTILMLSGGKDSSYLIKHCKEKKIEVDRYVFSDTGLEYPPVYGWLDYLEKRFDIDILRITPSYAFEELFYRVRKRGKFKGKIRGFPGWSCYCWVSRDMKFGNKIDRLWQDATRLIGICYGEQRSNPHDVIAVKMRMPLVEARITEPAIIKRCMTEGLYPPIYQKLNIYGAKHPRTGCWICPFVSEACCRMLFFEYPELWAKLEQYQKDAPMQWKPNIKIEELRHKFETRGPPSQKVIDFWIQTYQSTIHEVC